MKFTNMTLVQIPQMNSNLVCKHEYFRSLGFNGKYLKCVYLTLVHQFKKVTHRQKEEKNVHVKKLS